MEAIDTKGIGALALEFMEYVSERYGDDATIRVCAVVAEVEHIDPDGDLATTIEYACVDERRWIQRALFTEAADSANDTGRYRIVRDEDIDEEE